MNPVPFTVSVNPLPPGATAKGLISLINAVGIGAAMVTLAWFPKSENRSPTTSCTGLAEFATNHV